MTPRRRPSSSRRTSTISTPGCGRGIIDELLDLGALDAWHTPITMKRGRPAITIHALVRERSVQEIAAVLMDRTGTLGVRMHRVERVIRTREFTEVEVQGQRIAVKIARDARRRRRAPRTGVPGRRRSGPGARDQRARHAGPREGIRNRA